MSFQLPALPYANNALEPHIDARTMEIHHDKHHAAYVNNLNAAITNTDLDKMSIEDILANISKHSPAVRNNGGGHYNHSLFWTLMTPGGSKMPSGAVADAINLAFGSFDEFKTKFASAGA
ncbi:MAG: superoxide dismutase, partial [Bacteroidia bacterium]|nr:superoxide dismutase [Bacteroidia bacterium]